ncbi:MAG: DUF2884 family protein [Colwellia sp.]
MNALTTLKKSSLALIIGASLFATAAQAHNENSCNVELEAGISIDKYSIKFLEKKGTENSEGDTSHKTLYSIENDQQLIVNNETVTLNAEQQKLISEYAKSIRSIVPEIKSVAIEGVDLAVDGVDLAFKALLGEDSGISSDLAKDLEELRYEIDNNFTEENGFTIGVEGSNSTDIISNELEGRIESAIEKAVKNSMGTILVAMGKEMMFSGDSDAFEQRMENFGENIESEMEARSQHIEAKAEELCYSIADIDTLEDQIQNSIDELKRINVISVEVDVTDHEDSKHAKYTKL